MVNEDSMDTLIKNFAKQSGKSVDQVKKKLVNIEKGVAKSIDKEAKPDKYHAIVISTLKKSLGIS